MAICRPSDRRAAPASALHPVSCSLGGDLLQLGLSVGKANVELFGTGHDASSTDRSSISGQLEGANL